MGYCAYSAMPVGRFVLDVHGESRSDLAGVRRDLRGAADHQPHAGLRRDYRNLDRVYVPLDALAACGLGVEALGAAKASPELRRCLAGLAERTEVAAAARATRCRSGRGLAARARDLGHPDAGAPPHRHPHARAIRLSERVHLGKLGVAGISLFAVLKGVIAPRRPSSPSSLGGAAVSAVTDEPAAEAGAARLAAARSTPPCASCRKAQREAMFEIYSFCRAVDDIADDGGPRDVRLEQLQRWRADIDALYAGTPPPHLRGLARAVRTFDLQREDFLAVIDGMEMDVVADIRAPDLATLDLYCDRVASAVGRLSVRVFGMEKQDGPRARASSRPRAAAHQHPARPRRGRRHRPALSAARSAGTTPASQPIDPATVLASPAIGQACAPVAARAETPFRGSRGDHGAQPAPRRAHAAHHGGGLSHDARRR